MGALANGVCYPTVQEAANVWCGSAGGPLSNGSWTCVTATDNGSGYGATAHQFAWEKGFTPVTGAQSTSSGWIGVLQHCDPVSVADGLALSWQIGAVFVGVYAIKFLARAVSGGDDEARV